MNNKEIRKKALNRLSYYWVEAEFLFLIAFGLPAVFLAAAYVLILLFSPYSEAVMIPPDMSFFLNAFRSSSVVKAAVFSMPALLFILLSPLFYGVKWCYYQAAQGKNAPVSGAFYGYYSARKWIKAVLLSLIVMLRKLVYLIPIGAVGGAVYYIYINLMSNTRSGFFKVLLTVGIILVALGLTLIYMISTVKYQLIPYIFAEESEKPILEIYHRGIAAMSGSKGRFAAMQVWFVPMLTLSLTGYLGMFVIPYYCMVKSICAAEISGGKLFDEQAENEEEKQEKQEKNTVSSAV